jgi:ATP-dependent Clp protease adaptor protein ClpS
MVLEKTHKIILLNDSTNTYQYVMACLIRFCKHDKEQAEQCVLIAHNNGLCDVFSDTFNNVFDTASLLESKGLKLKISTT